MANPPLSPELHLHNLRAIQVLGNGAMGTVFLVHNHITDPSAHFPFALKVVEKRSPNGKPEADRRARWEVSVLERLNREPHPSLPSLIRSFENGNFLAWAVPYCSGGDLNVLRRRQMDGVFSPSAIRFYLAEIVCALEHLHGMKIVYRDLKPENILIQSSGHVTLTDFDLSRTLAPKSLRSFILSEPPDVDKHLRKLTRVTETHTCDRKFTRVIEPHHTCDRKLTRVIEPHTCEFNRKLTLTRVTETTHTCEKLKKAKSARVTPMTRKSNSFSTGERSNSFVGTDEYLAPEVIRGDGHEFAVDFWALGILAYEMLYGTTPFRGKNRKDTFNRILITPPKFTGKPTPLTDLITELLDKEPTRRLGYARGACEIKQHPFFGGLKWELLTEVVRPPFIPSGDDVDIKSRVEGFSITEYFQKPLTLESPSRDDCGYNVSLTEF
ncbi:hypothetical protein SSX86_000737 [Deinandra increscens subsp. villosa]|uniref:non-specific serine/threonine protein kinase n=1 Tax=Deinandra increscens subsp. villosa TaxID=3103831 RepID=A0AAP0DUS5_9ASTR